MTATQKTSTRSTAHDEDVLVASLPPSLSPDIAASAARLMSRAEAMGLISLVGDHTFSVPLLKDTFAALAAAGIGRQVFLGSSVGQDVGEALAVLNENLEASPHPRTEWTAVSAVLGDELVLQLTGVSSSSLRRYVSGQRETPDDVAVRLHFLALVIADLLGSYNALGVRRWFLRPRTRLQGCSPSELLTGDWDPDAPGPIAVAGLSSSLVTMGAT